MDVVAHKLIEPPIDIYDPVFVKGVFDRCSKKYIAFSLGLLIRVH